MVDLPAFAGVAQWIEQTRPKGKVGGSIPLASTNAKQAGQDPTIRVRWRFPARYCLSKAMADGDSSRDTHPECSESVTRCFRVAETGSSILPTPTRVDRVYFLHSLKQWFEPI